MLTEAEVQRSYRQILRKLDEVPDPSERVQVYDKAEGLLGELRPESPLRHRLLCELRELRKLADTRS